LRAKGKTVDVMESPFWTISRNSVQELAGQVKAVIAREEPELVIFQLIDNSSFYIRGEDGGRQLPRRTAEDHHLEGELFVCSRETQYEHLRTLRPLFDAVGKTNSLWLAPLPRYIVSGCCSNPRHAPNRMDPYFHDDMTAQLETFKRSIKDHIHSLQRKNIKVVDPNLDIRGMDPVDIWGEDPIKPQEEAAKKIVNGILLMASKFNDRPPEQQQQRQSSEQRGRGRGAPRARGRGRGSRTDYENRGGRTHDPAYAHGGRGQRGGHMDYRARPY
jgi:hypothetical protein